MVYKKEINSKYILAANIENCSYSKICANCAHAVCDINTDKIYCTYYNDKNMTLK